MFKKILIIHFTFLIFEPARKDNKIFATATLFCKIPTYFSAGQPHTPFFMMPKACYGQQKMLYLHRLRKSGINRTL